MKIRFSSKALRPAVHALFLAGLAGVSLIASAQQEFPTVIIADGRAGGVGQGVAGSPAAGGMVIFAGGNEISATLMKLGDANQDGTITPAELKAALVARFQRADTDANGGLSQAELAAALKEIIPVPAPPPGLPAPPAPPEEFAPHNVFARGIMAAVDGDKDGWVTFNEAVAYTGQNLSAWDADGNGSLDAREGMFAFGQMARLGAPEQGAQVGVIHER
ncbi:MAG: hypothetical protein AB1705_24045 [Verrucomicrobiota bacterium]